MTDQLMDEALAKRAEELANERYPFPDDEPSFDTHLLQVGHADATLDALKVHLDGLKVLESLDHGAGCAMWDDLVQSTGMPCSCGLDQHIASLKELLGVSQ